MKMSRVFGFHNDPFHSKIKWIHPGILWRNISEQKNHLHNYPPMPEVARLCFGVKLMCNNDTNQAKALVEHLKREKHVGPEVENIWDLEPAFEYQGYQFWVMALADQHDYILHTDAFRSLSDECFRSIDDMDKLLEANHISGQDALVEFCRTCNLPEPKWSLAAVYDS